MIKVNMLFDDAYRDRWESMLELNPILNDMGMALLDNSSDTADVNFIQNRIYSEMEKVCDPRLGPSLIIAEQADQEAVANHHRHLIRYPSVLAWVKECAFRDTSFHNHPIVHSYWHYNFMDHDLMKYPPLIPDQLTKNEIDKIRLIWSVASFKKFDDLRLLPSMDPIDRNIDIFFCGTMAYSDEILKNHRALACQAVGRLSKWKTISAVSYVLDTGDMNKFFRTSKIFISAQGYSMSSYKDWQALYAGCVLIKPNSEQQKNYGPDLFEDKKWFVECKYDFSDLEEVVDKVMSNYDFYWQKSQEARLALCESVNLEKRAKDFHKLISESIS